MTYSKMIDEYIDAHKDELIKLVGELISYESVRGEASDGCPYGQENARVLQYALNTCSRYGMTTKNYDNYIGSAEYEGEEDVRLGILCHLDVVPAGDGWSSEPFKMEQRSGRLYGRGAIDDKGPAAAAIFALRAVRELGIPLRSGVRLILGCDEENGSSDLDYYRTKESFPPLVFTPDGEYPVLNIEKGMIRAEFTADVDNAGERTIRRIEGGTVINAVPQKAYAVIDGFTTEQVREYISAYKYGERITAEESNDSMIIRCDGIAAHASTPELGFNAITCLMEFLSLLPLSDSAICGTVRLIAKRFPCGETDGDSLKIKMSDEESGALTSVLSIVSYDGKSFRAYMDIRFPLCTDGKTVLNRLGDALCGIKINVLACEEPHKVSSDSEFVRTLMDVYTSVTGYEAYTVAIGGGTYVHNIDGGVAFGAEFPNESNNMHAADESISEKSLLLNAKLFANAIARVCCKE